MNPKIHCESRNPYKSIINPKIHRESNNPLYVWYSYNHVGLKTIRAKVRTPPPCPPLFYQGCPVPCRAQIWWIGAVPDTSVPRPCDPCRARYFRAVPGNRILVPGSRYQDLGSKILVPRSWYQDLGTKTNGALERQSLTKIERGGTGGCRPSARVWGAGSPPGTAGGLGGGRPPVKTILWYDFCAMPCHYFPMPRFCVPWRAINLRRVRAMPRRINVWRDCATVKKGQLPGSSQGWAFFKTHFLFREFEKNWGRTFAKISNFLNVMFHPFRMSSY